MNEAPSPPLTLDGVGRQVFRKNPSQFPAHWAESMEPLPSEVLRPLRDARDGRCSIRKRLARLDEAAFQLSVREQHHKAWSASVDDRMDRCGMEFVDRSDPLQCAAFLARIDRKALTKRQALEVAIEVAKLEIQRLREELGHGH